MSATTTLNGIGSAAAVAAMGVVGASAGDQDNEGYLVGVESIDALISSTNMLFNPFEGNKEAIANSLSASFNTKMNCEENNNNNNLIKSLANLNMLNSAFYKQDQSGNEMETTDTSSNSSLLHQQCGICGKFPMVNGKTLVGCLHSFCQSCLIQATLPNSVLSSGAAAIIACPICAQETLVPSGGIDALMPHYSNPLLLNLNQTVGQYGMGLANYNSSVSSSTSSVSSSSSLTPPINNSKPATHQISGNTKSGLHSSPNMINNSRMFINNKSGFHTGGQELGNYLGISA